MKKLLVVLLVLIWVAAQITPPSVAQITPPPADPIHVLIAPSGSCSFYNPTQIVTGNPPLYYACGSDNTWHQLTSGAAAPGTVTSVGLAGTANQITVTGATPITTSGSWTLSITTNPTLPGTTTATLLNNSAAFAGLGTPSNGTQQYCSDCTVTSALDNTCAASGGGSMAFRIAGAWKCVQ